MLAFAAILATLDDPFYDPPEHLVKYETPQQRRSYTAWASKLRNDLVGDDSGYDKVVPPRSDARSAGEVAVEVRGDSGGTLKVSSAI